LISDAVWNHLLEELCRLDKVDLAEAVPSCWGDRTYREIRTLKTFRSGHPEAARHSTAARFAARLAEKGLPIHRTQSPPVAATDPRTVPADDQAVADHDLFNVRDQIDRPMTEISISVARAPRPQRRKARIAERGEIALEATALYNASRHDRADAAAKVAVACSASRTRLQLPQRFVEIIRVPPG